MGNIFQLFIGVFYYLKVISTKYVIAKFFFKCKPKFLLVDWKKGISFKKVKNSCSLKIKKFFPYNIYNHCPCKDKHFSYTMLFCKYALTIFNKFFLFPEKLHFW